MENKLNVRAGLQCVWGAPYDRNMDQDIIINNISTILQLGVNRISLCDTSGMATPKTTSHLLESIYKHFPKIKLCLHLHNTYGFGLKNLCSALGFGVKEFDTSLGGIEAPLLLRILKGI